MKKLLTALVIVIVASIINVSLCDIHDDDDMDKEEKNAVLEAYGLSS